MVVVVTWQHTKMLFELRRYEAQPGRRDDLARLMDEEIIPFQASCGVVVVGSFIDEENPDVYFWIRRFNDEEHRKQLYKAVYASDRWTTYFAPRMPDLMVRETMHVTRLLPTATSVLR
jgi:quinol monooxygenase YgiN